MANVLVTVRNAFGGEVGTARLTPAQRGWSDLDAVVAPVLAARHPGYPHRFTLRGGAWPEMQVEAEVSTSSNVVRYRIETRLEGDPRHEVPCCG